MQNPSFKKKKKKKRKKKGGKQRKTRPCFNGSIRTSEFLNQKSHQTCMMGLLESHIFLEITDHVREITDNDPIPTTHWDKNS